MRLAGLILVVSLDRQERKEKRIRGEGNLPPFSGMILALATDPADAYEDSRAKPFVRRYL
jgi:hypothetical protein